MQFLFLSKETKKKNPSQDITQPLSLFKDIFFIFTSRTLRDSNIQRWPFVYTNKPQKTNYIQMQKEYYHKPTDNGTFKGCKLLESLYTLGNIVFFRWVSSSYSLLGDFIGEGVCLKRTVAETELQDWQLQLLYSDFFLSFQGNHAISMSKSITNLLTRDVLKRASTSVV